MVLGSSESFSNIVRENTSYMNPVPTMNHVFGHRPVRTTVFKNSWYAEVILLRSSISGIPAMSRKYRFFPKGNTCDKQKRDRYEIAFLISYPRTISTSVAFRLSRNFFFLHRTWDRSPQLQQQAIVEIGEEIFFRKADDDGEKSVKNSLLTYRRSREGYSSHHRERE